ncbi:DegT/DnrJ/EryC1/StrS family aminotransferase [bacterium]|nr:DegT/DnrJ/EryC1/StrS family aminotransferase [bacterium]
MKALVASDLAILGGPPAFDEPLHVGRPNIGDRRMFLGLIEDMLDRRWLTNNGPYVARFEAQVAEYLGVRHCIAMCNGTVALEIAIRALELKGEVIVPSFTFIATAHALQWQEITPVFCDIDPQTHTIDPDRVEELITPRTSGIIGVHLWGHPCAVRRLDEITRRRRLTLMYDASHAFGCRVGGIKVGNFGRAEVFSFHATKFMNCLEGGAVVTNDDALARKIRLMKNFGFSGYDNVVYIGTNGKMNEASAAMGLTNLASIDAFIAANRRNQHHYATGLAGLPGVRLMPCDPRETVNAQYVVAEIDARECPLGRDEVLAALHAENVLARRYFWPGCHRMEPYRSYFPHASLMLPRTEEVAGRVLVLPNGSSIGPDEIGIICAIVRSALGQADLVRGALTRKAA